MRYDRTHLEQHRRQWRVRIAVPKDIRATIGKPHIVVSLGTESLSEAARLKHAVIAEIRQTFEEARGRSVKARDSRLQEALRWKTAEVLGGVTHGGTGLMGWCVGNVKIEVKANGNLATKEVAGRAKIDPVIAMLCAAILMSWNPTAHNPRSVYETRGVLYV